MPVLHYSHSAEVVLDVHQDVHLDVQESLQFNPTASGPVTGHY